MKILANVASDNELSISLMFLDWAADIPKQHDRNSCYQKWKIARSDQLNAI